MTDKQEPPQSPAEAMALMGNPTGVTTAATVGIFCPPLDVYGSECLGKAYWQVMSELTGEGLIPDLLTSIKPAFINALSDPKRAGRLLADTFDGINWDWPRWHAFANRNGYDTVPGLREMIAKQDLHSLLYEALKADLVRLAVSLTVPMAKSLSKPEMIERLMTLASDKFEDWVVIARGELLARQLKKVHRDMGLFVAARVLALAHNEHDYQHFNNADYTRLHPYWRFICPQDLLASAPRKCRDMNQKVLPAAEAMKTFPKIPCERLDCHCRFTTQRLIDDNVS